MRTQSSGTSLAILRSRARMNQGEVAAMMGVDQSSVSRIESGELNPTPEEIQDYLAALQTEEAKGFAAYVGAEWEFFEKPSFWHPHRNELHLADRTMAKLRDFVLNPNLPAAVMEQAKMSLDGLLRAASYLQDVRHNVAF